MKPRVLLTNPIDPAAAAVLERSATVVTCPDARPETLYREIAQADAMIVRASLPKDIFDHAPRLLVAARHGAGVDLIPVEAATRHGIIVTNVPGANANSVAEYVFAQILRLTRNLHHIERSMRAGGWADGRRIGDGQRELAGRTLGIVGVGAVGGRVAQIGHFGFGMRVLGHQRRLDALPPYVGARSLQDLFRESDFIVLAVPLNDATRKLVSREVLALAQPSAYLVNIARGPVVDQPALTDALHHGRLAGAALDVFEKQPLPADDPLWQFDNVLLSPHCSGVSIESARKIGEVAVADTLRVLAGEKPLNFFNPECWDAAQKRRAARV